MSSDAALHLMADPATHAVRCPVCLPAGLADRGSDPAALIRALFLADLRWQLGARGPQCFDCYSLTQLVQWHLFGRVMMDVNLGAQATRRDVVMAMRHHEALGQWRGRAATGMHGDVVHMAHRDDPWHIGTFLDLDRGLVVHCSERQGVRADSLSNLRATGWRDLRFYAFDGARA